MSNYFHLDIYTNYVDSLSQVMHWISSSCVRYYRTSLIKNSIFSFKLKIYFTKNKKSMARIIFAKFFNKKVINNFLW